MYMGSKNDEVVQRGRAGQQANEGKRGAPKDEQNRNRGQRKGASSRCHESRKRGGGKVGGGVKTSGQRGGFVHKRSGGHRSRLMKKIRRYQGQETGRGWKKGLRTNLWGLWNQTKNKKEGGKDLRKGGQKGLKNQRRKRKVTSHPDNESGKGMERTGEDVRPPVIGEGNGEFAEEEGVIIGRETRRTK